MSFWDAIIVGLVQGLTEFLPISSSGHLVIAQKLIGVSQHDLAFDIAAHLGTLLAIVTIYYALLRRLLAKGLLPVMTLDVSAPESKLVAMVLLGTLPTAAIGLLFKKQFEAMFSDMYWLGIGFIITAGVLYLTKLRGGARISSQGLQSLDGVNDIKWWVAILIGVAQGLAIAPSVSRSGMTIVAGILLGLSGHMAALYSFMLSLPAIVGAAVLEMKDVAFTSDRTWILAIGMISAYFSGLLGLWGVLHIVRRGRLEVFSLYLLGLGSLVLIYWV